METALASSERTFAHKHPGAKTYPHMCAPRTASLQARAIFEAAVACHKDGIDAHPEIMVPLVGTVAEFQDQVMNGCACLEEPAEPVGSVKSGAWKINPCGRLQSHARTSAFLYACTRTYTHNTQAYTHNKHIHTHTHAHTHTHTHTHARAPLCTQEALIRGVAEQVLGDAGVPDLPFKIGTMIEVRAPAGLSAGWDRCAAWIPPLLCEIFPNFGPPHTPELLTRHHAPISTARLLPRTLLVHAGAAGSAHGRQHCRGSLLLLLWHQRPHSGEQAAPCP